MASIILKITLFSLTLNVLITGFDSNSIDVPLVGTRNKETLDERTLNGEDNEAIGNALINYILSRSLDSRIRNLNLNDANDMQKKGNPNTYFKQCSFNAVSCFGRRK